MDSIVKGVHYELTSKTGGCTVCVTGYLPGVGRLLVGLLLLLQLLLVLVLLLEGEEEGRLLWQVLGVEGGVQAPTTAPHLDADLCLSWLYT